MKYLAAMVATRRLVGRLVEEREVIRQEKRRIDQTEIEGLVVEDEIRGYGEVQILSSAFLQHWLEGSSLFCCKRRPGLKCGMWEEMI